MAEKQKAKEVNHVLFKNMGFMFGEKHRTEKKKILNKVLNKVSQDIDIAAIIERLHAIEKKLKMNSENDNIKDNDAPASNKEANKPFNGEIRKFFPEDDLASCGTGSPSIRVPHEKEENEHTNVSSSLNMAWFKSINKSL